MKIRIALIALAAVLAVTGCSAVADEPAESEAVAVTVESEGTANVSPAPETPEAVVANPDPAIASDEETEAAFLSEVRSRLAKIRTQIPDVTDEQLIVLAYEACDRIAEGTSGEDMTLIEGEERTSGYYMDTAAISTSAALTICPRS